MGQCPLLLLLMGLEARKKRTMASTVQRSLQLKALGMGKARMEAQVLKQQERKRVAAAEEKKIPIVGKGLTRHPCLKTPR
jgi:hypothetical protein